MQTTALLAGVENHRVGRVAGDGGLTKIVRTFHARFGSVKTGAGQTPRQRIAYVRREGRHAVDAADVEATAGDKEKVLDAADRLEAGARIRRGPTADRLLATQVIELPAESTPEQRAKCAQAFVDDWRERGHPAIATVHVDGEERGQPHLHVEIAARPVHADGEVDRAVRLWRGKPTIYAERQKASDLVNRTCDPDPPYHPGGFRDIGREGDTPKKRIPAGSFRAARKGIREALALEQAEMIDGAARVVSEAKRAPLREAHEKRAAEIVKFKAAREWPPLSQRARLEKRAETSRVASGVWYRRYKNSEAREVDRTAERDQERERGDTAEVSAATLTDEKRQAGEELDKAAKDRKALETELNTAKADAAGWEKNTLEIVKLAYEQDGRDLPDLGTDAGLAAAAEFLEGGAGRAELAAERDNAKNETATLRAHSAEQTKFLTGVHRENGRDLPDLETGEGRSEAWAFARAVMKAGREAAAEKKELEQRAAPEQLQQPADEALRYFTAGEREAAETRQRKAEAKKAKRGEQSEKEKADGEISEACKPVYRIWKQTGQHIGRAMADGGELAAAAEAYGQYHGSPLSLRKDATEEKLAGVLAAINAAAARLGAEPLKRPLTVEEAAAEYEQRRPKTNAERLAASGAAALAAEEEERLRPAKELAAEIEVRASWNQDWRSPAPASGKSRLQTPPRAVEPEPAPARQVQTPKLEEPKPPLNPRSRSTPTRDGGR